MLEKKKLKKILNDTYKIEKNEIKLLKRQKKLLTSILWYP